MGLPFQTDYFYFWIRVVDVLCVVWDSCGAVLVKIVRSQTLGKNECLKK